MAQQQSPTDSDRPPTNWRPLALGLVILTAAAGLTRLMPPGVWPWNFAATGALALFAGARLRGWQAYALPFVAWVASDIGLYLLRGDRPFDPFVYASLALYIALGHSLLRRTESPLRIGGVAVGASAQFFLVTNFGSWAQQTLPYGYTLEGLMNCYWAALPFYRGTFVGDMVFSAALFGAYAVLTRAAFPAERVLPAEAA